MPAKCVAIIFELQGKLDLTTTPFDANAQGYDLEFTESQVGRLQRQLTYDFLSQLIAQEKPKSVLELNCGTGADALWMAQHGLDVTATDLSAEMVKIAAAKTKGENVKVIQADIQSLEKHFPNQQFDLIWSNFGGLNCLSPSEIEVVAESIAKLLKPNGQFVAVVMGKFCAWETLYFLSKFRFGQAFRRLKKGPIPARLADGVFQDTYYYSPNGFEKLLKGKLKAKSLKPIGAYLPPSYLDPFFKKRPKLLARMASWENKSKDSRLCAKFSDHFLLAFGHQ